jgi:hypothetical protein
MRISEVGELGKTFSGGDENKGVEKKDYLIGTICVAGALAFLGFSKKFGEKIANGVGQVCKDCYNYFTKGKSENNSIRSNFNKDTEELHELLQPIEDVNRTCNDFSNVEKPEALIDGFIYKGEKNLLFSPSNSGKTIYALQIAIETAKKYPKCKVIYFNQEMSESQVNKRLFPDNVNVPSYYYPSNLILKPKQKDSNMFTKSLLSSIEQCNGDVFVILDNITQLCPKQQSNDATNLVNDLDIISRNSKLKKNISVTSLIVAHTVKGHSELLSENDFKGKSTIYDLVDAAFAIGTTRDKNKYIVKLKQRNEKFSQTHLYIHEIKDGNTEKPYLHMELIEEAEAEVVFPPKNAKTESSIANNKKRSHQGKAWTFTDEQISFLKELYENKYSSRNAQKAFAERFGESPCHTHISKQFKDFKMAQMA